MSAASWSILVAAIVICGSVMHLLLRTGRRYQQEDSEAPTQILWTAWWTHEAPNQALNVVGAHRIMQQHRNCDREDCQREAVAYQVLVEAGRIRPDSGRTY